MTLYNLVLSVHILAAVGIVGGSCLEHYLHARMRRARSLDTLMEWVGATKTISKLMPIFALTLLICGVYMTFAHWNWQQPWIIASLALLIAISAAAPLLLDPNLRAVQRAATQGESLATIARLLAAPAPNLAGGVFTAEALAIVVLMTTKPELTQTLVIVVVAAVVGLLLGWPRPSVRSASAESVGTEASAGRAR